MTRRSLVLLSAVLVALLLLALAVWTSLRPPQAAAITASQAPLVRTLQFAARVATPSRVDVGSTLTARVREVRVSEGASVAAGDVLIRLDSEELRATLSEVGSPSRELELALFAEALAVKKSEPSLALTITRWFL